MISIKSLLCLLFIIVLVLIITSIYFRSIFPKYVDLKQYGNLHRDGFIVVPNVLSNDIIKKLSKLAINGKYLEIKKYIISNHQILDKIRYYVGNDYIFQDYIFMIMKSNIHTCHRDNNGLFFNKNQKYPSYTVIFYLENMDSCLDIIPKSHTSLTQNSLQLTDRTQHISCSPGSLILFDANLVHTGSFNKKPDNMRIQMKITHPGDITTLDYYNKYNKYIDKENSVPLIIRKIQKHISCQFPAFSDITQSVHHTSKDKNKDKNKTSPSIKEKIFSFLAYGNPNYYSLPTADK